MTTDKLYQRIDYYCMLIYTQSLIWPATRPHYLLNFGSEKIGPRTIKLAFVLNRGGQYRGTVTRYFFSTVIGNDDTF